MKSQADLLKRVIDALDAVGIEYMVAGSIASSLHGHPRATNDLDIVVSPSEEQLARFAASLGQDYYISEEAAKAALEQKSMFNLIDNTTGWKVDLVIRKERAFSKEEFDRRRKAVVMGLDVFVASPEDVILSKLEWAGSGDSHQQLRDALGVVEVQGENLDRDYLEKWAVVLDVVELLESILQEGQKNESEEKGGEG